VAVGPREEGAEEGHRPRTPRLVLRAVDAVVELEVEDVPVAPVRDARRGACGSRCRGCRGRRCRRRRRGRGGGGVAFAGGPRPALALALVARRPVLLEGAVPPERKQLLADDRSRGRERGEEGEERRGGGGGGGGGGGASSSSSSSSLVALPLLPRPPGRRAEVRDDLGAAALPRRRRAHCARGPVGPLPQLLEPRRDATEGMRGRRGGRGEGARLAFEGPADEAGRHGAAEGGAELEGVEGTGDHGVRGRTRLLLVVGRWHVCREWRRAGAGAVHAQALELCTRARATTR
jgi:hypothetical protein